MLSLLRRLTSPAPKRPLSRRLTLETLEDRAVPATVDAPLIQTDLYFGRNVGTSGQVTEQQFQTFIDSVVTPRFPLGLTLFDARGQFLDSSNTLVVEPSKLLTLIRPDSPAQQRLVNEVITAYKTQFMQESVLEADNRDNLTINFDAGDLFPNSDPSKFIQADLFFGRNINGGGQVSEAQFQTFIDTEVTPRFPDGLTLLDARGQFRGSDGSLVVEPSKELTLLFDDTPDNETSLNDVITAYKMQFMQESVLTAANEAVGVSFGDASDDLFVNDPVPQLIQVDLYFGRNIGTSGQVTEAQFQNFIDTEVTPRFPDGLTLQDARGQFRDSMNNIIVEPSKLLTLFVEDTTDAEAKIHQVVEAYKSQFMQESVLIVTDENVGVSFEPDVTPTPIAVSFGAGGGPVRKFAAGGLSLGSVVAYAGFQGGVDVAQADVTGDGVLDLITGTAEAADHVKVFDGVSGAEVRSFLAFGGFGGGVSVGGADVNGDGCADVFVGAGPGAPGGHVKVFDGATGAELMSFFAFAGYSGGVSVAGGDADADGVEDVIVGAAAGHVKAFSGATGAVVRSFFAFAGYGGRVSVASGDVDGDGFDDLIVGAAGSHVKVFGRGGAEMASFFAFPGFSGDVSVSADDADGDLHDEIVVAVGPGSRAQISRFDGSTLARLDNFFPATLGFIGETFVG